MGNTQYAIGKKEAYEKAMEAYRPFLNTELYTDLPESDIQIVKNSIRNKIDEIDLQTCTMILFPHMYTHRILYPYNNKIYPNYIRISTLEVIKDVISEIFLEKNINRKYIITKQYSFRYMDKIDLGHLKDDYILYTVSFIIND